ncbi:hypothetical protein MUN88_05305 [Gracilibacillus caseinilyticus]|uniref:Bacteriocin biosynthesis cyclodehydratase domain-containing protein n=1 Tax=Gracilibacillus caseinilyticus TaxID=2932256 RepID=A0ABY4EYM6_9BACI|nr:hypothetical protein [Gracilibacillus caseinilyticus]UOQ49507.1 hypothetical protein MUN88_05305 [Gracilibacillus caseinilyticus]
MYKPKLKDFIYYSINGKQLEIKAKNSLKLTGESIYDIYGVLELCNGKFTIIDISKQLNQSEYYITRLINFLEKYDLLFNNINQYKTHNCDHFLPISRFFEQKMQSDDKIMDISTGYSLNILFMGQDDLAAMLCNTLDFYNQNILFNENLHNDCLSEIDLIIAIDTFENTSLFYKAEKLSAELDAPMLRVILDDTLTRIGPIFIHNETCCYECLLTRKYSNLDSLNQEKFTKMQRYGVNQNDRKNEVKYIPGLFYGMCGFLEDQIFKFFSINYQSNIVGKELKLSMMDISTKISQIPILPYCKCNKKGITEQEGVTI